VTAFAAADAYDRCMERGAGRVTHQARYRSNKAIAERLFITEHTVEKHVQGIFAKLDLSVTADDHRRVLAVLTFLNSG